MPEMPKPQKWGIGARRELTEKKLAEIDPTTCMNRLAIIFDDSGSMSGQPLIDAKNAVKNFTASCNQFDTSIAVVPLSVSDGKVDNEKPLTVNYDLLNLFVTNLSTAGGTPLYKTMIHALEAPVTRLVVFSDGDPTDDYSYAYSTQSDGEPQKSQPSWKETWLEKFKEWRSREKNIPHDTIYIGHANSKGYNEMKWIAEQTGGIFIHFKDSLSLSSNLKYLAPALRGYLANPELKAKIERGETI